MTLNATDYTPPGSMTKVLLHDTVDQGWALALDRLALTPASFI